MPYGLKEEQIEGIKTVFAGNPNVAEVILFGSRAKGNYKPGSDVDFALKGIDLKLDDILALNSKLEDLNLPYIFDLLIYDQIKDIAVIDHINRAGISFYKKN